MEKSLSDRAIGACHPFDCAEKAVASLLKNLSGIGAGQVKIAVPTRGMVGMGLLDWLRRRKERRREQEEAREAYKQALSRLDLHVGIDQLRRTLDEILKNAPDRLRQSHRDDAHWSQAHSLVSRSANDEQLVTNAGLAKLNLALTRLVGLSVNSLDWAYEQINLARIDRGMKPTGPRRQPDLLLNPDEEALLVEDVTMTHEVDSADSESGHDIVVSEQRILRIEVTTRRLALMTDHASVFDLKQIRVARLLAENRVSLTIEDVSWPVIFSSDIARLIRATIEFGRHRRLGQV